MEFDSTDVATQIVPAHHTQMNGDLNPLSQYSKVGDEYTNKFFALPEGNIYTIIRTIDDSGNMVPILMQVLKPLAGAFNSRDVNFKGDPAYIVDTILSKQ